MCIRSTRDDSVHDASDHDDSVKLAAHTVSFHNFKLQNLKLSVSNPKNKYVAYLSVQSRISNCQSLGRKNKHELLKTGRTYPEAHKSDKYVRAETEHT